MTPLFAREVARGIAMNGLPAESVGRNIKVTAYRDNKPVQFLIYQQDGEIAIRRECDDPSLCVTLAVKVDHEQSVVNAIMGQLEWSSPTPF